MLIHTFKQRHENLHNKTRSSSIHVSRRSSAVAMIETHTLHTCGMSLSPNVSKIIVVITFAQLSRTSNQCTYVSYIISPTRQHDNDFELCSLPDHGVLRTHTFNNTWGTPSAVARGNCNTCLLQTNPHNTYLFCPQPSLRGQH